jgi:hypothetical protein
MDPAPEAWIRIVNWPLYRIQKESDNWTVQTVILRLWGHDMFFARPVFSSIAIGIISMASPLYTMVEMVHYQDRVRQNE